MSEPAGTNTKPKTRALPPGLRPPMRWYHHSDEGEGMPGKFFCRPCDIFTSATHFTDTAHKGTYWDWPASQIYAQTKQRYEVLLKRGERVYRPSNAKNLWQEPGGRNVYRQPPGLI